MFQLIKYTYGFEHLNRNNTWNEENNTENDLQPDLELDSTIEIVNDYEYESPHSIIKEDLLENNGNADENRENLSDNLDNTEILSSDCEIKNELCFQGNVEAVVNARGKKNNRKRKSDENEFGDDEYASIANPIKIAKFANDKVLFTKKYFSVEQYNSTVVKAKCCSCKRALKGYTNSSSNFISHLKRVSKIYFESVKII